MKFHPFAEKFPLLDGPAWSAFKAEIAHTGGNKEHPIFYRLLEGGVRQGLDGRSRLQACQELGLEPTLQEVAVADDEVVRFIARCNIHRRHLSKEARQELVAALREQGESIRAIGDAVGASHTTVNRDLQDMAEAGQTPSGGTFVPPDETTKGKDGKIYGATRPQGANGAKPKIASYSLTELDLAIGKAMQEVMQLGRHYGVETNLRKAQNRDFLEIMERLQAIARDVRQWKQDLIKAS